MPPTPAPVHLHLCACCRPGSLLLAFLYELLLVALLPVLLLVLGGAQHLQLLVGLALIGSVLLLLQGCPTPQADQSRWPG
jgi:hypothetical protein